MIKFKRMTLGTSPYDRFTAHYSEAVEIDDKREFFSIQNKYGEFITFRLVNDTGNDLLNEWRRVKGLDAQSTLKGAVKALTEYVESKRKGAA
jgi:uncharacterized protein YmfQ (DUF2313 family)